MGLQSAGEIMFSTSQPKKKVSRKTASLEKNSDNKVTHITVDEAIKLNLTDKNIPPRKCEFCGRTLRAIGLYINVKFFRRWIHGHDDFEECNCEGTLKHQAALKRKAEERARIEKEKTYQAKVKWLMEKSKLGKRFMNRTFKNFKVNSKNRDAYNTAKRYADEFKQYRDRGDGLIFVGSYGTGKTHLAAAICHQLIKQEYQPIFGTMITLLGNIKTTYNSDDKEETEEQVIQTYTNCDLLIVDDLGKERPTDWALEKLYYIINTRYEKCLPIVITTNYDIDKLIKRLTVKDNIETAQAIVSRIYEICVGVDMIWEDYRKTEG